MSVTDAAPVDLAPPLETDSADAVFEGGGVKGIALVGALEAARAAGIERWVNVAGTSAGAIIASLLAVGYGPEELRRILERTDYQAFADYGWGGRYIGGARNALRGRGLCMGRAFTEWLGERFAESPLGKADPTFADVERDLPADLSKADEARARWRLRVIASDVTAGKMLVLPDDIGDYLDDDGRPCRPEELPIASAVRMSMSFPYFFEPVTMNGLDGRPHFIVDGGLLSNFPVFLFDGPTPPLRRWTFGFRLYSGAPPQRPTYRAISRRLWPVRLTQAMFLSAMEAGDRRVSDASGVRTIRIPTGDVRTLAFTLSSDQRDALRDAGHQAGETFFRTQTRYINHAGVEAAGPAAAHPPVPTAPGGGAGSSP